MSLCCPCHFQTLTGRPLPPVVSTGPLGSLAEHLANPFGSNWTSNIGHCVTPATSSVQGLTIPLTCLWPGQH